MAERALGGTTLAEDAVVLKALGKALEGSLDGRVEVVDQVIAPVWWGLRQSTILRCAFREPASSTVAANHATPPSPPLHNRRCRDGFRRFGDHSGGYGDEA